MHKRILFCAALVAACGKSSTGSGGGGEATGASGASSASSASGASGASGASAAPTGPQDHCEVKVTGDVTLEFKATSPRSTSGPGNGKLSAGTDYWMSDEDLHDAIKMMNGALSKDSDEQLEKEAQEQMKKDPRMFLLLLNCGDEDNFLSFGPDTASKYADVPFKAGTYRLIGGSDKKPGDFSAMVGIHPPGHQGMFEISKDEPGTLEIKKFDLTGIAGTFHFKATTFKHDKTITVDGSFDYGCKGRICKE